MLKEKILELIKEKNIDNGSELIKWQKASDVKVDMNIKFGSMLYEEDIAGKLINSLNNKYNTEIFNEANIQMDLSRNTYVHSRDTYILFKLYSIEHIKMNHVVKIPYNIEYKNKDFYFEILTENIEEEFINSILNLNKNVEKLNHEKEKIIKEIRDYTTSEYLNKLDAFEKDEVAMNMFNSFRTLDNIRNLNSDLRDCLIKIDDLRKAKKGADLILKNLNK